MMRHDQPDSGFIVLDALVATVLASLAGTAIVLLTTSLLRQQDVRLDQSVGLVMSQSLIKQFVLLGPGATQQLELEDELYSYEFVRAEVASGSSLLSAWTIVATPKLPSTGAAQHLDFLAPNSRVSQP